MSQSPNLSLPYIQPSQAQKHVTHNLAIERLDALVQLSVTELEAAAPPSAPFDGQVVGVGENATGDFAGEDGKLAYRTNGSWMFVPPRNGFKAWVEAKGAFYVHQDGLWQRLLAASDDEADGLGLNTTWDATNRLSVSSPATLLSHEGAGHRLKVNKAGAQDTASLLFQTGFSGRAEMGLAGDDDFSVKVSADGEEWSTAFTVDATTGDVDMGRVQADAIVGNAVQSSPADTTPGRLMRADWGYGPGNVVGPVAEAGGVPTGAVIERGSNASGNYTRWADGTQICSFVTPVLVCDNFVSFNMFYGSPSFQWTFPAAFIAEPIIGATAQRSTGSVAHFATIAGSYGPLRTLVYLVAASDTSTGSIHLTATGRWF